MEVSVVMASCNPNYDLLKLAICSVISQTYKDFELIIVDDGSKEHIEPTVRAISSDERIKVFRIQNFGLGAALNYGVSKSHGKYIARLDDDDIMLPERLHEQVCFMEKHPEVSCAGTWHYDKFGDKFYPHRKFPILHEDIVKSLLNFRFSLAHTTLMYRRDSFDKIGGYRIPRGGQDLDFELQLGTVGRLANVPAYLNYYTMSVGGLGTVNPMKYKAYLFALQDVVDRNLYPDFQRIAMSSIDKLQNIEKSPLKNIREKLRRYGLITRIKILGKNLNNSSASKC